MQEKSVVGFKGTKHLQSKCIYGYRKITASLHNFGIITNHKKVVRIMREIWMESGVDSTTFLLKDFGSQLSKKMFIINAMKQWLKLGSA